MKGGFLRRARIFLQSGAEKIRIERQPTVQKFVRTPGFNSVGVECFLGKILLVPGLDHIASSGDGCRENMMIVRIRKHERWAQ